MRIVVKRLKPPNSKAGKPTLSNLEEKFLKSWEGAPPTREHRFHPARRWRFDFAWLTEKVAVEIQGGLYVRGKHSRPAGIQNDNDKLNEAQRLGWIVLQFGPKAISSRKKREEVVRYITKILTERTNVYQIPNSRHTISRTVSKVPKRRT